jgi:Kef-type K+ transport system membrane component KefB
VDFEELRKGWRILGLHLIAGTVLLGLASYSAYRIFHLPIQAALVYGLALVTPSTGFILDSLPSSQLTEDQRFWVKTKAIGFEIVALVGLFFVLQSGSGQELALATASLLALVAALPLLFLGFARLIAPVAPNSEFAFFLMLAITAGMITKKLGVYYLVGAFLVGVSVQQFRHFFQTMDTEKILFALRSFASFFTPFYFFHAGSGLSSQDFSWTALGVGLLLALFWLPLRLIFTVLPRRLTIEELRSERWGIALSLLPTLVFGLVLAGILKTRFLVGGVPFGALVTYTLLATLAPGLIRARGLPLNPIGS